MSASIALQILDDKSAVAIVAAKIIVDLVNKRNNAVLGLATGSTPVGTYQEMIKAYESGEVSYKKVRTFNLDEYWGLDSDHEQSYRSFMNSELFSKIDLNLWNTHVLDGKAVSPELECESFEKKIQAVGGVDLWLLGIGGNGHIAFNEPGSLIDSRTRLVPLSESTIQANSDGRFFDDPADVPCQALTAGIGTIREAGKIILLATGATKADALKAAVEGPVSPDCPASLLQGHPDVTFIVDKEAASILMSE